MNRTVTLEELRERRSPTNDEHAGNRIIRLMVGAMATSEADKKDAFNAVMARYLGEGGSHE